MDAIKNTYYVDINVGEVSKVRTDDTSFVVEATDEEIKTLMELFRENYDADFQSFLVAHRPYKRGHAENEKYDDTIENIYAMIYKIGNAEAKHHIEKMGILELPHYDNGNFT